MPWKEQERLPVYPMRYPPLNLGPTSNTYLSRLKTSSHPINQPYRIKGEIPAGAGRCHHLKVVSLPGRPQMQRRKTEKDSSQNQRADQT
jgi:hypothetical protein